MTYIRIVPTSNGELELDDNGNLLDSKMTYNFGDLTDVDPVFRDVDHLFITGELREAIRKKGLTGLVFKKIEAIKNDKKVVDEEFYQISTDERAENPDFYLYDGIKLAASPDGVKVLKKLGAGFLQFIDLDEMSDSEKFYADFEEKYAKGEL